MVQFAESATSLPDPWNADNRPRGRIYEVLNFAATHMPDRVAVIDAHRRVTFAELNELVAQICNTLSENEVQAGTRVIVSLPNTVVGVALLYALAQLGAVTVPLNPYWSKREIKDAVLRSEASLILVVQDDNLGADSVLQIARTDEQLSEITLGRLDANATVLWETFGSITVHASDTSDEVGMILFTSGSTAAPKGVLLTHNSMIGVAYFFKQSFELTSSDRYLLLMPLYHVGGLVDGLLSPHLAGAAVVMAPKFDPEVLLNLMETEGVTATAAFDSMFHKILSSPAYHPSRHATLTKVAGGENDRSYARLLSIGISTVLPSYGLTEVASGVSMARPDRPTLDWRGTVGLPTPGLDVIIVDPETEQVCGKGESGEIRVRGWAVSPGYVDGTDGRDHREYFKTGDIGFFREDGALCFEGRLKSMIKSGGENVSVEEVQRTLVENVPEIVAAAVLGVPDDEWGEVVVAFVEFVQDAEPSIDEVRSTARKLLAGYKTPKRIWALKNEDWPMLPAGKLDRKALQCLAETLINREKSDVR